MKITLLLTALTLPLAAFGQARPPAAPPANAPVPVTTAPAVPGATPGSYVYEQKPITGLPQLITPQQAQTVIEKFKAAYPKLGSPRILIHVNRDLVDEKTGTRLASRNERTDTTRTTVDSTIAAANAAQPNNAVTINAGGAVTLSGGAVQGQFPPGPGKVTTTNERQTRDNRFTDTARAEPTLADKQTARDVERLFGRPLRMGGASLADQRVATQLLANRSLDAMLKDTNGEAARKDREALAKIADVALEVLISTRQLVIREVSGDKVYQVPDIQVSAIRLKDAAILGQASASDILGRDRYAGRIVTNFDIREITEAVALALMEDMTLTVK
ncbi:MAG: hypothetical protein EXS27_10365 [Pedosphaera sp.]|nr:hypothetical protein [Pedosphaera sp.]